MNPIFQPVSSTFFTAARRTASNASAWGTASALESSCSRFETDPSASGRTNTCSRKSPIPRLLTCEVPERCARPAWQALGQTGDGRSCRGSHHMAPHGNSDNTSRATDAPSPRPVKVGCPPPDASAVPSHLRHPPSAASPRTLGRPWDNDGDILQLARLESEGRMEWPNRLANGFPACRFLHHRLLRAGRIRRGRYGGIAGVLAQLLLEVLDPLFGLLQLGSQNFDQTIRALNIGHKFGPQLDTVRTLNFTHAQRVTPFTLQLTAFSGERLPENFLLDFPHLGPSE